MTNEQIIKLVEAGFTAADIRAMMGDQPDNPSHDEPAKDQPQTEPEVKKENRQDHQEPPTPADNAQLLTAIKTMGDNIVSALQRAQIGGSSIKTPNQEDTIESMVASIINPYEKK